MSLENLQLLEQRQMSGTPALQHRHKARTVPQSHLSASLTGSAASCLKVALRIKHCSDLQKSTMCLQSGLYPLADEFYGMHFAFQHIEKTWSHSCVQKLWTKNATQTVKHAQQVAQDVAEGLRDIVNQFSSWDIVAPDHVYYQLQAFEMYLRKQQLILNLLGLVMYVLSPSEVPDLRYCSPFCKEQLESEKFSYACEQLGFAALMRREMQANLLKIASLDPEYKDIDIEEFWEDIPAVDGYSSKDSTMGNMTPSENWSDIQSDTGSSPIEYSFVRVPEAGLKRLVKRQKKKGTIHGALDAMLDSFGHEGMRGGIWPQEAFESRRRDLAKLVFHWTNVETFAGLQKNDSTSVQGQSP